MGGANYRSQVFALGTGTKFTPQVDYLVANVTYDNDTKGLDFDMTPLNIGTNDHPMSIYQGDFEHIVGANAHAHCNNVNHCTVTLDDYLVDPFSPPNNYTILMGPANYRSQVFALERSSLPINRAPVLTPIGNKTVGEGVQLQFTVSATDPDGDILTYSASNLPSGATFNPTTRTFSWTPTTSQSGNYTVTFAAADDGSPVETGTLDVLITVGDDPTPPEQAENLVDTVVTTYDFPTNVENSYLSNLKKVEIFIEEGKIQPAINQLNAFITKVNNDYAVGTITQAVRDNLLGLAQALLADLQP